MKSWVELCALPRKFAHWPIGAFKKFHSLFFAVQPYISNSTLAKITAININKNKNRLTLIFFILLFVMAFLSLLFYLPPFQSLRSTSRPVQNAPAPPLLPYNTVRDVCQIWGAALTFFWIYALSDVVFAGGAVSGLKSHYKLRQQLQFYHHHHHYNYLPFESPPLMLY